MVFGPLSYLGMIYLNREYKWSDKAFLLPGMLGIYLFIAFFLVVLIFFRRFNDPEIKREPSAR
jgi:hypothetical protein